jgi:hypothetical protein
MLVADTGRRARLKTVAVESNTEISFFIIGVLPFYLIVLFALEIFQIIIRSALESPSHNAVESD